MSAMPPLTDETAAAYLDVLEQRFGGSPAKILQIPERADVLDACVAFAGLVAIHAPRHFAGLAPGIAARAQLAHDRLRQALGDFVAESRQRPTLEVPEAVRPRHRSAPIASRLRRMIDRRELRVTYEPIVDLATGAAFGYEAQVLAAAIDSPSNLFDVAAARGFGGDLGRIGRRLSIERCPDHALFLSLHPAELADRGLLRPDDAIFRHDRGVYLEIKESTENLDLELVDALRDRGMQLVIDRLGVGRSNLNYLAELTPAIVKLDPALTTNLTQRDRMFQLLSALVVLCHDLGASVIASGITTESELEAVKEAGADLGQGRIFGPPTDRPAKVKWPTLREFSERPTIRREQRHR